MSLDDWNLGELTEQLVELDAVKRVLLVFAVWVGLAIASFFVFWQADLDRARQSEKDIQSALTRLKGQSQLLLEQPAIEVELVEFERLLPELKKTLPSERELASLLGRINEMILNNALRLTEFTPQPHQELEVMRRVPVKVSVRGDATSISKLPNYIASLSRQVTMKEFEISLVPEAGVWQLSGELNAFAQLTGTAAKEGAAQ